MQRVIKQKPKENMKTYFEILNGLKIGAEFIEDMEFNRFVIIDLVIFRFTLDLDNAIAKMM